METLGILLAAVELFFKSIRPCMAAGARNFVQGAARSRLSFLAGVSLECFQSESILFLLSVVPGFIDPASTRSVALQLSMLGTAAVVVASIVHSTIVIAADQSGRWIADNRIRSIIRRTLSAILGLMALWLAWGALTR